MVRPPTTHAPGLTVRVLDFFRASLRGRLALLVIATTVPGILLVWLLIREAYQGERAVVGQHLLATARAVSVLIDSRLGKSEALLAGLATAQSLDRGDVTAFEERVRTALRGLEGTIVLADPDGRALVVAPTSPAGKLPAMALTGEFGETMRAGRTFYSNLLPGPTAQRPFFIITVPVTRENQLKYTLSYVLPAAAFAQLLEPSRFSSGLFVAIIDREGTIAARNPNGDRFVGGKVVPDMVAAILAQPEGIRRSVTLEGVPALTAFSRGPETGWGILVGAPTSTLYTAARRLLWTGLVATAIVMALAFLMASWIGHSLIESVDRLVADTDTIGRGGVPATRGRGLAETDFVAKAIVETARRLSERNRQNATLTVALRSELAKQKRAQETNERLAAIVASSHDAIIGQSLTGEITSWNQGAQRIFGYTAQEIVGRTGYVLVPPHRREEENTILSRVGRGERFDHVEVERRHKDGRLVALVLTVWPLHDEAGQVMGSSTIAREVTVRPPVAAQPPSAAGAPPALAAPDA